MYKEIKDHRTNEICAIRRITDGAVIPISFENLDYVEYQKWLDGGNSPEPADNTSPDYRTLRQAEYPSIGDQLDMMFHAGMLPRELTIQIQAIKAKYPKV